jgi:hypothetical protein
MVVVVVVGGGGGGGEGRGVAVLFLWGGRTYYFSIDFVDRIVGHNISVSHDGRV